MKKKARRKKPPTVTVSPIRKYEFPEVKGKVIEAVWLYLDTDDASVELVFSDKTDLTFDLEPLLTVRPDLSDWKTHNYRAIKRWPPLRQRSSWAENV